MTDPAKARTELKGTGFSGKYTHRGPHLFVAVYGSWKTGKTHFAKTAPGVIAYQGVDYGHHGVIDEEVERGHVIPATDYEYPNVPKKRKDTDEAWGKRLKEAAEEQWTDMHNDFLSAAEAPNVRTIVWDTGTEFYETMTLARCGRLTEIPGLARGKLKREFATDMRTALNMDKNFIFLAKEGDVWKNNRPTDKTMARGFSELGYYAEVVVRMTKKKRKGGSIFFGEIMDCRLNRELEGEVVEDIDWPTLVSMVRPDITEEDLYCDC